MDMVDLYMRLMDERPGLFDEREELKIITDKQAILSMNRLFEYGKVGVRDMSFWHIYLADLVEDRDGKRFIYERMVNTTDLPGVCIFPFLEDQRIVLLRQFRHALRNFQLAIPRGFGEFGISAEENAKKEINEELGTETKNLVYLGNLAPDSGILGVKVQAFSCTLKEEPKIHCGYEEIEDVLMISKDGFFQMIQDGEINDSFTLGAAALLMAKGMLIKTNGENGR